MARRLIAARLIVLMKYLYGSAGPAYREETGLANLEWRVLMQVGDRGPMALTALATLLHQDKGQVSHAVKKLAKAKLLAREHLRAPITLTKAGRTMFSRIFRLGRARNAALIRALSATERRLLPQLLGQLQANAANLLAQELALRSSSSESDEVAADERPPSPQPSAAGAPGSGPKSTRGTDPRLVAQDLFALQNLLQRSAALTYRRETGLLDFEWRVLSQVGEHAPLTLIQLMPLLSRDKGQVGRTLGALEERGLISREKIGGGRHVLVQISDQGREVYSRLAELALKRNDVLLTGFGAQDEQHLVAILDKLTEGAKALVARHEKALA
jgi:DNA-binding MarR family transcriptional regulator